MKGKHKGGITGRGMGWEFFNSWWILLSFFALSWIGFFIIGRRARQKKWIVMGIIFCLLQFVLFFFIPKSNTMMKDIIMTIWCAAYIAGIILSFALRKKYLICRDVLLNARIAEKDDQQLRASVVRDYEKQGVQGARTTVDSNDVLTAAVRAAVQPDVLAEEDPKKRETAVSSHASQATVPQTTGQPAQPPFDINNCTEQEMSGLSGVSVAQAKKAIEYRRMHGGFSTVDEFFQTIALKPHFVVQLEGELICGQYRQEDSVMQQAGSAPNKTKDVSDAKPGRKLDF